MSEFLNKVSELVEKDGLNKRNRRRQIIYKKCYLQHKLRESGMTFKEIGKLFNQHHASVIHNIRTHEDLSTYYNAVYSNEISEYVSELTGIKIELPKRNLVKDVLNASSMYHLHLIKKRIKENKYDIDATFLE